VKPWRCLDSQELAGAKDVWFGVLAVFKAQDEDLVVAVTSDPVSSAHAASATMSRNWTRWCRYVGDGSRRVVHPTVRA
jgi:hypothetical protein